MLSFSMALSGQHLSKVAMDDFFGVNITGGKTQPEDIVDIAQWVRHYTRWSYFESVNNQFDFKQAKYPDGIYDNDAYYQNLKKHHIKSLFVLMKSTDWASSDPAAKFPQEYAPSGEENGLDPMHYREIAEFYYQLIARYGTKTKPAEQLLTDDKLSGMALIDVIEVENEPDGPWHNQMTLQQYAALLNAVYDGNQGQLGPGYGIKAADPDMVVSVGGVAYNLEALKKIVQYAGRVPFDVVNVHFYCFKFVREKYRVAIPPEWSSLEEDMAEIVSWRNTEAPGRPVWLTEIGWDTKDYQPEQVTEQEAADYLIRSYLLALGVGVEKVFWFILKDFDDFDHPTTFSSSGLYENSTTEWGDKNRLKPKMTYWYNATFKNLTAGYFFHQKVDAPNGDSTVYQYEFFNADQSKKLVILWTCPSFAYKWHPDPPSTTKDDFLFSPGKNWQVSKITKPVDGSTTGKTVSFENQNENILLRLSGTPVFLELNSKNK